MTVLQLLACVHVLACGVASLLLSCSEESQVLLARLMSGYGRDASLNAKERKAPGTASITQLPGSPSASRGSNIGSEALDGGHTCTATCYIAATVQHWCSCGQGVRSNLIAGVVFMSHAGKQIPPARAAWQQLSAQDRTVHVHMLGCRTGWRVPQWLLVVVYGCMEVSLHV